MPFHFLNTGREEVKNPLHYFLLIDISNRIIDSFNMPNSFFSVRTLSNLLAQVLFFLNVALVFVIVLLIVSSNKFGQITFLNTTFSLLEIGKKAGTLAAFAFCATIIPGILRRFRVTGLLKSIQIILTPIRPHFGVLMVILALAHYLFVKILPTFRLPLPFTLATFEIFGVLAFFLAFPLALTSNIQSKKLLGKNWQRLHLLVYIILWLIFIHVALLSRSVPLSVVLLVTGAFQIGSLFLKKR